MDVFELLQQLGFGEYDAKAYAALLQSGRCNGYEVAKAAGIPRANVYGVLARLVERGAARRYEAPSGVRYTATPARQLLAHLDQSHQRTLDAARHALTALEVVEEAQPVFNLASHDELITQARTAIDACQHELLIALQPSEAGALADVLRAARERGVAITTLCLEGCVAECGGCQGDIHRLALAPVGSARWLLLVADRDMAVIGQTRQGATQGVATHQTLFIELTTAYIRQSLALAMLGNELAGRFDGLLSEQARRLLERLYPGEDFLAHIQSLGSSASS